MQQELDLEKKSILKGAKLHWMHWTVVVLSLLLTFTAWKFSKNQVEERTKAKFDRQVKGIIDLVNERMFIYKGALWGGVAAIKLNGGDVDSNEWSKFSESLEIEKKYPGISGIGVIHRVLPGQKEAYLKKQRQIRADYNIHPRHSQNEYWPITYVEPVASNRKAVGLDMAHETNRFTAAKKARDTGAPQITGPIVLVQDSRKTPGFLFYIPYYRKHINKSVEERKENFSGLVYAPFIVEKLMEGALQKTKRQIGFSIKDGDTVIYDEHNTKFEDYDAEPLFKKTVNVDFYGRSWQFDLWSANSFREAAASNQPLIILMGGIFIDSLLLILFVLLSRSNQRAISYAERVTRKLKRSNEELEQFSYRTSHDLLSPIKSILGLTRFIREDSKNEDFIEVDKNIVKIQKLCGKLSDLIADIMSLSRSDNLEEQYSIVDIKKIETDIRDRLSLLLEESKVNLVFENQLRSGYKSQETRLTQILENLISNGIKYCDKEKSDRKVVVKIFEEKGSLVLNVQDNGIGIPQEYQDRVFSMFKRFHPKIAYGSGLGLYLVKKHVDHMNGKIEFTSNESGTVFRIILN